MIMFGPRGPIGSSRCTLNWQLLWFNCIFDILDEHVPGSSGAAEAPDLLAARCSVRTTTMSTTTIRVLTSASSEHWLSCSKAPQPRNSTACRPLIRSSLVFSVA